MNRDNGYGVAAIEGAFGRAAQEGRAALVAYLTAGYPTPEATPGLVAALQAGGADLIELGVPFSDPVADGPAIQRASQRALEAGMTPEGCMALAAALRADGIAAPLVLMGYYNPILSYGVGAYAARCAEAGVDGLIVPDLPPEEAGPLREACMARGLALVYLVAPTSSPERLAHIAAETSGFLYVVSRLGTTGEGHDPGEALARQLEAARRVARTPVAVGFGIARAETARALGQLADGVIVGSAIVERAPQGPEAVRAFVGELRAALGR
jgi:tryptophan synthase alpha chain